MEVRLEGIRSNRDGIGARILVVCDGVAQTKEVRTGSSYLSSNSMWISFGLGKCSQVQRLEIRWPSGGVEVHEDLAADRVWREVEERGIAAGGGEHE